MAAPSAPNIRRTRTRSAAVTRERRGGIILAPIAISDRAEMTRAASFAGREVAARGVAPELVWTAFATLVDNALTHGGKRAPVAAVYLTDGVVTVSSRDSGLALAGCTDAKNELRRRIQLPAEADDPDPGAPAGIPWLARQLMRCCADGDLAFMAGDGRLLFSRGRWTCRRAESVNGFVAIARLPVAC